MIDSSWIMMRKQKDESPHKEPKRRVSKKALHWVNSVKTENYHLRTLYQRYLKSILDM